MAAVLSLELLVTAFAVGVAGTLGVCVGLLIAAVVLVVVIGLLNG